jgi:hypothetical protein
MRVAALTLVGFVRVNSLNSLKNRFSFAQATYLFIGIYETLAD